jgi:aspartate-semialdehyde dehydrogenase
VSNRPNVACRACGEGVMADFIGVGTGRRRQLHEPTVLSHAEFASGGATLRAIFTGTGMARRFEIAVLGAGGPVGEALIEGIAERRFPAGEISALALNPESGEFVTIGGLELAVENAETFDFSQVDLTFLVEADEQLAAQAERAADAGCAVIDASGLAWRDPAIPVVVPELNATAMANYAERGIIANPSRLTVALALALAPLNAAAGLRRLSLTGLLAASDGGRVALEDLARETTALLNARHYERRHFPQQIAFNLHGQSGTAEGDGYTAIEARIGREMTRLLGLDTLDCSATLVQAPSFYGHAAVVEAGFERPLEAGRAAEALRGAPGVEFIESPSAEDCPTPVTDGTQSEAVRVARLRASPVFGHGLAFWLTADNIRRCAALNALGNAEILIRDYL